MLSLSVDSFQIGKLCLALLLQRLILGFGLLVISSSINIHDFDLLISVNQHFLGISPSFVDVSNCISLDFVDHNFLSTFSFSDQNGSILFGFDLENFSVSLSLQNLLLRVNLGSFDLSFELKHLSFVVSLLISQFLIFLIFKSQSFILLLFFVVFQSEFQSGFFLKCPDQSWINNDVGHIALFKNDSVLSEFRVKLIHHDVGHVRFQIEHLRQPNTIDESSHVFLYFSCQKLIKSCSSKLIYKDLDLLSILWHSESEMDIDIYVSIVFCRASLDRSIIVHDIFC